MKFIVSVGKERFIYEDRHWARDKYREGKFRNLPTQLFMVGKDNKVRFCMTYMKKE